MGLGWSSNPSQSIDPCFFSSNSYKRSDAGACQLPQNFDHRMPKIVHRRCVSAERLSPFAAYTTDANVGQTWLNLAAALTKSCEAVPVKTAEQLVGCGYSGTKTGPEFSLLLKCSEKFHKTLRKSWLAPNFAESVWEINANDGKRCSAPSSKRARAHGRGTTQLSQLCFRQQVSKVLHSATHFEPQVVPFHSFSTHVTL